MVLTSERAFLAGMAFTKLSLTHERLALYFIRRRLCPLHKVEAMKVLNDASLLKLAVVSVAEGVPRTEISVGEG